MNINIGEYYEHKLAQIVARGVAATKTEALRMAVAAFERQLEDEERHMVESRVEEDLRAGHYKKFKTLDEVLAAGKLNRAKL